MREYVFQATGVTHELFGEGLEDRVALAYCTSSLLVAGVADGMGSCAFAAHAAEVAARAATHELLEVSRGEAGSRSGRAVARAAVLTALSRADLAVRDEATRLRASLEDLGTTLMTIHFDASAGRLDYGYVGDGGILVRYANGNVELLEEQQRDAEGGTHSLTGGSDWWRCGGAIGVVSLLVCTDGMLSPLLEEGPSGRRTPGDLARWLLDPLRPEAASREELDALFSSREGGHAATSPFADVTDDRNVMLCWASEEERNGHVL